MVKNMKKLSVILLCLTIALTFFGCSSKPTAQTDNSESVQTIEELTNSDGQVAVAVTDKNGVPVTDEAGAYVTELATPVTDKNNEIVTNEYGQYIVETANGEQIAVGEATATTAPTQAQSATQSTATTAGTATATTAKTTTAKNTTTTTKKNNTTTKPAAKKQTTTAKPTTTTTTKRTTTKKSQINCTVIIKANDQTILDSYIVTVDRTETLINILKQACDENSISIETKKGLSGVPNVTSVDGIEGKWYCCRSRDSSKKIFNLAQETTKNGETLTFTID